MTEKNDKKGKTPKPADGEDKKKIESEAKAAKPASAENHTIENAPKTDLVPPPGALEGTGSSGSAMPSQPRTFVSRPLRGSEPDSPKPDKPEPPKPGTFASEPPTQPADAVRGPSPKQPAAPKQPATPKTPAPRPSTPVAGRAPDPNSGGARSSFPRAGAVAAAGAGSPAAAAEETQSARSPSVGGDTVRLRLDPSKRAKSAGGTFPSSPGKAPARRLPDIRRRQAAPVAAPRYGPFSLFFGFIWLIFKMLFFTTLVMGLAAAAGYAFMHWYIRTDSVTVPNVRGMKVNEAFDVLSEKKLGMIKVRSESSGLVAPGEIIEQNPQAGSNAKEGRAVGVVVSSGRSRYMVPNVVGESVDNARNKIKGAGLEVGNELRLEDPNVPKEAVISQQPAANTGTDDPVKVDLLVSSGPPGRSLTMPDLSGRTLAEARAALSRLGITDISSEPPDATANAVIVTQEPLVGKSIFQTDRVVLTTR